MKVQVEETLDEDLREAEEWALLEAYDARRRAEEKVDRE